MSQVVVTSSPYVPYDLTPFFLGEWEHMTVQHWGVLAGVTTYCVTVIVVLILVVAGGTFQRLREQAANYEIMGKAAFTAPLQRYQLYDELLEARRSLPLKPNLPDHPAVEKTAKKEAVRSWWGGVAEATTAHATERIRGIIGQHVELVPFDAAIHMEKLWEISNGSPQYAHGAYDDEELLWRFLDAPLPTLVRKAGKIEDARSRDALPITKRGDDGAGSVGSGDNSGDASRGVPGPPSSLMTFRDSATMSKGPCICDPGPAGLRLVVIDRSTQYIAGMVSILDNSPMDLRCRVGDFWLTPAFQRTHLATAAMLALLSHLLGPPMRCRRIEWHCDNRDGRSRKSAERYGFVLEGVLRKHRVDARGCNVDTAVYAMTNSDWRDGGARDALAAKAKSPSQHGISAPTRPVAPIAKPAT